MLEDLPIPFSDNWMYDKFSLMDTSNIKRKPEEGDKLGNSLKLLKINSAGDMEADFLNLSLSLPVNSSPDNPENVGDGSASSSLIPQIGVDNSPADNSENAGDVPQIGEDNSPFDNLEYAGEGSGSIPFILIRPDDPPLDDLEDANLENANLANAGNARDGSETSCLIPQLGEDNSINCIARCSRSDYGTIAQLNSSFRTIVEGQALYTQRRQLGIVEHWIYFSCHVGQWRVFDPIRLRWKHLPIMPPNECFMSSDKESLAVGTELLVFGKSITSHLIYKYSLLTNSWTIGAEMITPRCLFGSASFGEKAIVAGGCDVWGHIFSCAELYNSDTGTWESLPSMNKPRKKCSAVFMDGKFYVIGGLGSHNSNPLTCGEVYDLERRTWTEIQDMLPLRSVEPGTVDSTTSAAPPLLTVVNNELYAADYARKDVRKYNKRSNSWATVGTLPERAASMHGWGLAFRGCGDKLIVLGGPRSYEGNYVEVNSWTPSESLQQWTVLGKSRSGGFVYNCAIMGC